MQLSDNEQLRYSRQIVLPQIGLSGQKKLRTSKLLIIGAGGLGSPAALYAAAAGVGTIGIADDDAVEISNLQRQILHTTDAVGSKKTKSAQQTLQKLNPHIQVLQYPFRIDENSIDTLLENFNCVIDATDSFESKFLINDHCVKMRVPLIHAGVVGFTGQLMTIIPGITACYRCIFKNPPPKNCVSSCAEDGILGSIAGVIGSLQVTEAIKILCEIPHTLQNKLFTFDGLSMRTHTVKLQKDPKCPVCSILATKT